MRDFFMLFNQTRRLLLSKKIRFANTFFEKARGLMFVKPSKFDFTLLFDFQSEKKWGASIHMLFVFFPIAAVFLNEEKKVVDLVILNPFVFNYTPRFPARYLLELSPAIATKIQVGDHVEW